MSDLKQRWEYEGDVSARDVLAAEYIAELEANNERLLEQNANDGLDLMAEVGARKQAEAKLAALKERLEFGPKHAETIYVDDAVVFQLRAENERLNKQLREVGVEYHVLVSRIEYALGKLAEAEAELAKWKVRAEANDERAEANFAAYKKAEAENERLQEIINRGSYG